MNTEAVAHYIAEWMSGYLDGTGAAGFVVGVSGGIDSAVVSTLAAMTGRRTLCVTLPIHQAQAQVDRAGEHVRRLTERYSNAEAAHADLTAAYDAFAGSFAPSLVQGAGKGVADLAGANARSRLRMTALYYFAGLNNLLVAGTGNKIEDFGVGFFTKYGDGGVDISPIADLTKTEVYELGRWLRVPEAILVAPPTDGLSVTTARTNSKSGPPIPNWSGRWLMRSGVPTRHFCRAASAKCTTFSSDATVPTATRWSRYRYAAFPGTWWSRPGDREACSGGAEGVGVGVHTQGLFF